MKTLRQCTASLSRLTLATLLTGVAFLAANTQAQDKGAERLLKLSRPAPIAEVQKVQPGETAGMSCPTCKDTWVKLEQRTGKAANPVETKIVQRHGCPGCASKLVTTGVGKQATAVVKHTCKQGGRENAFCCAIKTGSSPATGMDASDAHHH